MDNETKISLSFKNNVDGEKKLERYQERLENIYGLISGLNGTSAQSAMQSLTKSSNSVNKNVKDVTSSSSKLGGTLKTAFNVGSLAVYSKALHGLAKTFMQLSQKSTEYIENVNLLEVAYKNQNETIEESSARIEKYIQKMADVYGLDESRLTRQFGIFKQLANAMQLPTETAENLSEIMVKMTNDIASLYNLDLNRASNALQSALAGQVRPIRSATGADITEKTLQNTVLDLGLDRTISELSYVEKRLIMVVSLTNQLKVSQGDYARTIESASNQIRVMHEQWDRLSRAVGNVFYPILQKVLPWINGILMALTEIFNLLASFLGFKMPEFDYSGLSGVSDLAIDIEDEMAGAGEATDNLANKLKGLRSFDKLNVINTPSASKASVGGGGVGGSGYVDPKIMDAFNKAFSEYDDKLDSVRMKASKIKDDIMHWLGFEKEINEETGKIEWKYQGFGKTLQNLWSTFKKLNPLAQAFVSVLLLMGANKIVKGIANLSSSLGKNGMGGSLKLIGDMIKGYGLDKKHRLQGIMIGADVWKEEATKMERFTTALVGTGGVIVGLSLTKDAMKKVNDEGLNLKTSVELLGGTMSSVLGGAMIGASIGGGWGAIIGGIAGGILDLGTALFSYESSMDKLQRKAEESLEKVRDKSNEIAKEIADTEMELASQMSETNYHEKILDELDDIIDANGKIKAGYEDRANYILDELSKAYGVEYQVIDGVLQKSDEVKQSIKDQIALKEQEIILEAYKEDYIEALKRQNELYNDLGVAEAERKNTLKDLDELLSESGLTYEEYIELQKKAQKGAKLTADEEKKLTDAMKIAKTEKGFIFKEVEKLYKTQDETVRQARKNFEDNNDLINRYSDYSTAVLTGNMDEVNKYRDEYTRTWVLDGQIVTNSEKTEANKRIETQRATLKRWKENNDERYTDYKNNLKDMSQSVEDITPEIVEKWTALGNLSKKDFMKELQTLDEDVQKEIVSKMYTYGYNIDRELQRGLDSINLSKSVVIKPDDSAVKSWINNNQIFSSGGNSIFQFPTLKFASGGLPPVGQLFIANEQGPELVSQIGGQSFVANQKQIGEYMDKRYGSYAQPVNLTMPVSIGGEKLGTIVLNNLQDLAKTNGQSITIG